MKRLPSAQAIGARRSPQGCRRARRGRAVIDAWAESSKVPDHHRPVMVSRDGTPNRVVLSPARLPAGFGCHSRPRLRWLVPKRGRVVIYAGRAPAFLGGLTGSLVGPYTGGATRGVALGPPLRLPGVALDRRALTIPPTQGLRDKKQTLYKRCAVSGLRMGVTYVFLRVWCDTFILINAWGRSSAGRASALQVDKTERCACVRFRR